MKVAINGFGRIGRAVMRQILEDHPAVEVCAINDIAPLDMLAYLFRYDSTYGPFRGEVQTEGAFLILNGRRIPVSQSGDVTALSLTGVDVLLECTGKCQDLAQAQAALATGSNKLLISGPCTPEVPTVILGANDDDLGDHRIVSNASCTTNAIAPLVQAVDTAWGLQQGHVTTVHCYTNSQPLVDGPRATPARSRAAAQSMIPTTTSATHLVTRILPRFKGRLTGAALRVPSLSVSCIDAVIGFDALPSDPVAALQAIVQSSPVMSWTDEPLVSSDLRGHPASLIVAGPEIMRAGPNHLRIFGWYDNEWGFSARMLDMAHRMAHPSDTGS